MSLNDFSFGTIGASKCCNSWYVFALIALRNTAVCLSAAIPFASKNSWTLST